MVAPQFPKPDAFDGRSGIPIAGEPDGAPHAAGPSSSRLRQWGKRGSLSSLLNRAEAFLTDRPFERMPWLAVAMLAGIGAWFVLPGVAEWLFALGVCGVIAGAFATRQPDGSRPLVRSAAIGLATMFGVGLGLIWARSELVGTPPIGGPVVAPITATVLEREEQPSLNRVRLMIATRDPREERTIRARINIKAEDDRPFLKEGANIAVRARLTPPTHPVLPGAYDFARVAWFDGVAATGSALDPPRLIAPGAAGVAAEASPTGGGLGAWRRDLARHVRERLDTVAGIDAAAVAIGATLASGDRSAIDEISAQAMRDAGLAHLLSISGLHVGAVVAIAWFVVMRIGGLFPAVALRWRLPILAGTAGAGAALGYTLLTGAALPTIRACIASFLVLFALSVGRQALSLRLIAIAAMTIMFFWPEAVVGPSFQFSFAAVIAIVAFHNSAGIQDFLARREEGRGWWRPVVALFLTGLVVEACLSPLVLFHFHRTGVFGPFANLVAIPLTTALVMPLLGLSLALDLIGLGGPVWMATGWALQALIEIAFLASGSENSVILRAQPPLWSILLFAAGFFWCALWSGRIRLYGLIPMGTGVVMLAIQPAPDLMIAAEGRHVAIADESGRIYLLRDRAGFTRDALLEHAGVDPDIGDYARLENIPGAECNRAFCRFEMRQRRIMVSQRRATVDYAAMVAACTDSDIVIAEWKLPGACKPRSLKADRALLTRRGGMTYDFESGAIAYARNPGDGHGWRRSGVPAQAMK
ncbi:ComEC/Rec2 family competence protein [Croceicoccus hydrothermalis]|uniref:ComEC/Rec2 family competence protein n=1 Tax=Croceicoccus hydrothermalis TaxID=2867964 RepID=UPI001EFB2DF5|nr:ComEC/Rec2 family competence protein [Croceicoccus hydrothermalis]